MKSRNFKSAQYDVMYHHIESLETTAQITTSII